MSRIRRISLRVAQREISLTVTQTIAADNAGNFYEQAAQPRQPSNFDADPIATEVCPDCGAPWLPDFSNAFQQARISLDLLQASIRDHRVHLRRHSDGTIQVCERSFQEMRERSG